MAKVVAGYEIGTNSMPIAAGVVCRCGEGGFCPAHGLSDISDNADIRETEEDTEVGLYGSEEAAK